MLKKLPRPITPPPWDVEYVREAVRHIVRNCRDIGATDSDFSWDRYDDADAIAALWDYIKRCDEFEYLIGWAIAIVSNVSEGDLTKQKPEWQEAARKWLDTVGHIGDEEERV
jgi:hypothetical protein